MAKAQHWTVRNWLYEKAPGFIRLIGDKAKPEPATHIIEFPGGAIELSRTDDGDYWAHIITNRGQVLGCVDGLQSARGEVIRSRLDDGKEIRDIDGGPDVRQIAVLIRPTLLRRGE